MDNPYAQSRDGLKALNHSDRTKGQSNSLTSNSMYKSGDVSQMGAHKKPHGSPAPLDLDNFQFDLHTSFASEPEAMGLELLDLLTDLC
jgi:hypothetical protein